MVSLDAVKKRYFVTYLVGLVCAYVYPISYLLRSPDSSLNSLNRSLLQLSSTEHPLSILTVTLFTADRVASA